MIDFGVHSIRILDLLEKDFGVHFVSKKILKKLKK